MPLGRNLQSVTLMKQALGQSYRQDNARLQALMAGDTISGGSRITDHLYTGVLGGVVSYQLSTGTYAAEAKPSANFEIAHSMPIYANANGLGRFLVVGNNITAGANCCAVSNTSAAVGVTWSVRVTPAGSNLLRVADNNPDSVLPSAMAVPYVIIAVGADGVGGPLLLRSTDFGLTWTSIALPVGVNDPLQGIAGTPNGIWVAKQSAGSGAAIYSTDNGLTWAISSGANAPGGAAVTGLGGVAVIGTPGNKFFLSATAGGSAVISSDGNAWEVVGTIAGGSTFGFSVVQAGYRAGLNVALGFLTGQSTYRLAWSTDLRTWAVANPMAPNVLSARGYAWSERRDQFGGPRQNPYATLRVFGADTTSAVQPVVYETGTFIDPACLP